MAEQQFVPNFGPLAGLTGTWEGVKGWNVISVPTIGEGNARDFKVLVHNYYETLTFAAVNDEVLNEGGTVDQYVGPLKYKQEITEFDSNKGIHVENGMIMYTGVVKSNVDGKKPWQPPFEIARSGTIPHGSTITLLGNAETTQSGPVIPEISTYPNSPDVDLTAFEDAQAEHEVEDIVTGDPKSKIFDVKNPNDNLVRDNNGLEILETTHFRLDSQNSGDVVNIPFVSKFANATRVTADFWLQKLKLPMSDTIIDQLQYSQTIDIEFPVTLNGQDVIVRFPHVTINTMKRKV